MLLGSIMVCLSHKISDTLGKTGYELAIANNHTPTTDDTQLGYINIKGTTTFCVNTVDATGISCATQGGSTDFGNHEIKLVRSAAGEWSCTSDLDAKFKPNGWKWATRSMPWVRRRDWN